jgi:hypothetical protein
VVWGGMMFQLLLVLAILFANAGFGPSQRAFANINAIKCPAIVDESSYNYNNSCYSLGERDGMDLAYKFINACHELNYVPTPPGNHSKEYLEGWNDGFLDADAAASNDDGTYGNGCVYYYNENGTAAK